MSKYLCEDCKFNNNGWCKKRMNNGLKKLNVQICNDFRKSGTTLIIEKDGKDYLGQELISIKVNDEVAEIPIAILDNFIKDNSIKSQEINIPD